jgi:hypothetical protein
MVCLIAALLLGILIQLPLSPQVPVLAVLWPTYLHVFLVGWLTQLIFGVAFWLFPRYSAERPRGNERLGWWSFALLNFGLVLRVIGEPWRTLTGSGVAGALLVGSAFAQWLAGWAFAVNTWPRLRER